MFHNVSPDDDVSCLEELVADGHPPLPVDMSIQEFFDADYDDLVEQIDLHHLHTECYRLAANEVVTGDMYAHL